MGRHCEKVCLLPQSRERALLAAVAGRAARRLARGEQEAAVAGQTWVAEVARAAAGMVESAVAKRGEVRTAPRLGTGKVQSLRGAIAEPADEGQVEEEGQRVRDGNALQDFKFDSSASHSEDDAATKMFGDCCAVQVCQTN